MNQGNSDTIVEVLEHVLLAVSNSQHLPSNHKEREELLFTLYHVLLGKKEPKKGLVPIRMNEQMDADMKKLEDSIQNSCCCPFLKQAM